METTKMTSKGQVLIPKRLRSKYGIKTGIRIALVESPEGVFLKPMDEAFFNRFVGLLKEGAPSLEEVKKWKKEDKERENKTLQRTRTSK